MRLRFTHKTLRKLRAGAEHAQGCSIFTSMVAAVAVNNGITKSNWATRVFQREKQDIHV